ncbi:hypothetical protein ES703_70521 [subsurface metagenome]
MEISLFSNGFPNSDFLTGSDSPVKEASFITKLYDSIILASVGILSP